MSTREMLISLIDEMTEEQMLGMIDHIKENTPKKKVTAAELCGILSEYADPAVVPLEKTAWETYVTEKYCKKAD